MKKYSNRILKKQKIRIISLDSQGFFSEVNNLIFAKYLAKINHEIVYVNIIWFKVFNKKYLGKYFNFENRVKVSDAIKKISCRSFKRNLKNILKSSNFKLFVEVVLYRLCYFIKNCFIKSNYILTQSYFKKMNANRFKFVSECSFDLLKISSSLMHPAYSRLKLIERKKFKQYIGVYVRRGDKVFENNLIGDNEISHTKLIDIMIKNLQDNKRFLIVTDDKEDGFYIKNYLNLRGYKSKLICLSEQGYIHKDFMNLNENSKLVKIDKMLKAVSLLERTKLFIGDSNNNLSLYIFMKRNLKDCIDIRYKVMEKD